MEGTGAKGCEWSGRFKLRHHNHKESVYTAPKEIGIYHVIAMATIDGATLARAVAKVTVVMQYDTRPN